MNRRLAHTRLAGEHQRPALPGTHRLHQSVELAALGLTINQPHHTPNQPLCAHTDGANPTCEPVKCRRYRRSGGRFRADVVTTLLDRYPDLPANEFTLRPHAIYKLSRRQLPPFEAIPTGAQYRANRIWVLLDQLQTADRLAEAYKRSRELMQPK